MLAGLIAATPAKCQNSPESEQTTMTGAVVSSSRSTLVVRGDNGRVQLFVFDRDTVKPRTLAAGSRVRVSSSAGEESGVRLASEITVLSAAPAATSTTTPPAPEEPVPPQVRKLEREIQRQARRYQAGVSSGVALDPELILLGVRAQVGPFFSPDVFLRPSVEFDFGEVTALFALNLEGIYKIPVSRTSSWSPYVGLGPGFTFLHQNFETTTNSGKKIDFGDFHGSVGLNILGGVQYRSGMFFELKASAYSRPAPTMRLIVGYNF